MALPTHSLLVRVPPALYERIEAYKRLTGQSINSTTIAALEDFFERLDADRDRAIQISEES